MSEIRKVENILQIIPAENWQMESKKNTLSPLVCWALCEDQTGKRFVTGMFRGPNGDPTLFPCSEINVFEGYSKRKVNDIE